MRTLTPDDEMPVRCTGCAFTAGTEANRDQLTTITAELCLQSGEPFFCHANAVADKLPRGRERVCRGYSEARETRPPITPPWKRAIAREALAIMEECADGMEVSPEESRGRLLLAGSLAEKRSRSPW